MKYLQFVASYQTGRTTINSLPLKDREAFYAHHTDTINNYEVTTREDFGNIRT